MGGDGEDRRRHRSAAVFAAPRRSLLRLGRDEAQHPMQQPDEPLAVGMEQAVVATAPQALGQDVTQQQPPEVRPGQGAGFVRDRDSARGRSAPCHRCRPACSRPPTAPAGRPGRSSRVPSLRRTTWPGRPWPGPGGGRGTCPSCDASGGWRGRWHRRAARHARGDGSRGRGCGCAAPRWRPDPRAGPCPVARTPRGSARRGG